MTRKALNIVICLSALVLLMSSWAHLTRGPAQPPLRFAWVIADSSEDNHRFNMEVTNLASKPVKILGGQMICTKVGCWSAPESLPLLIPPNGTSGFACTFHAESQEALEAPLTLFVDDGSGSMKSVSLTLQLPQQPTSAPG